MGFAAPISRARANQAAMSPPVTDVRASAAARIPVRTPPSGDEMLQIIRTLPDVVFRCYKGEDGKIYWDLNEGKLAEEFHLTTKEVQGKPLEALFPPDTVARLMPEFEAAFRGEAREFTNELFGRYFKHYPQPVFDANGRVKYVVGFISEVTSLERAQQQLSAANKELESFAYTVSHDLRTPLTVIDTYAQVLRLQQADALGPDGRAALERVQNATRRMAQLIDDLLRLSRATRGDLKREPVDLTALATAVAADLKLRNAARQVEFQAQPGMTAVADARLVRVVMENLLSNAWKYTSHHPYARIEVGIREVHGRPAYFVKDDGAGFDMRDADRLFRPFTRLHPTAQFEGTGIGLATVQRIVERHGGEIWGEGAPEKGATFTFTL